MSAKDLSSHTTRLRRRSRLISHVTSRLETIRILLFIVGYGWLLLLPWNGLSRRAWIDENALQPGQVNVDWNWADVKMADAELAMLETIWNGNMPSDERAALLASEFVKLGLEAGTQRYSFATPTGNVTGTNVYAISRSPRTSGTEAMVIAASWISRQGEGVYRQPNLRGVATVLSLAQSLPAQSVWAKDLIFLISDSYLDGAHAWLSAYHGSTPSWLEAEPLVHPEPAGVIWTALALDYPGHSFSHLGLFFEGTNARLPNQDLCNSASTISRSMGVPFVLYHHKEDHLVPINVVLQSIGDAVGIDLQDYVRRARNIWRHLRYQAIGEPSGIHGVFHKYRIDAITLYAIPARGPHGFHSLGRVVESLLRTSNNLLERLHASFFFYLFTAPGEFAEFARYLPPVIILGLAASFGGLSLFVQTGWIQRREADTQEGEKEQQQNDERSKLVWVMRDRPVLEVLCIMGATHAAGLASLALVNDTWFWAALERSDLLGAIDLLSIPSIIVIFLVWLYAHVLYPRPDPANIQPTSAEFKRKDEKDDKPIITPLTPLVQLPSMPTLSPTTPALLKAFNLCILGAVISVIAVANFSLGVSIAVLSVLPLCLLPVSLHRLKGNEKDARDLNGWTGLIKRVVVGAWVIAISPMGMLGVALLASSYGVGSSKDVVTWAKRVVWEFTVLKTWFIPLVCNLYLPIVLQGVIVCLLPV